MDDDYKEINYEEICKFYWSIYFKISETVSNIRWNDELIMQDEVSQEILDKYEKESLRMNGWLERGTWRLGDLEDMLEYSNEYYFFYYAMECLSSIRHRFEEYLNDTDLTFPSNVYDYTRYDDIVIDYYQPIKLIKGRKYQWLRDERDKYWKHYYSLLHRKANYEYVDKDIYTMYRELAKLKEYVHQAKIDKDYDYDLSKIHELMERFISEVYRLKLDLKEK